MLARLRALEVLQSWVGKTEVGFNNRGPFVEMLQRADRLPGEGYAWCQTAQNAAWRLATGGKVQKVNGRDEIVGGEHLGEGTASVGLFTSWARSKGYVVARPFKGDQVAFQFGSDSWPDHVGMVERVLQLGPILILQTIEGNTSPGDGGSQDDGGGIYRRRRVVRASKVIFVRVPGNAVLPPKPQPRYEHRYDVYAGKAGTRSRVKLAAKYAEVGGLARAAALALKPGETVLIDKRRVKVSP